MRISKGLTINAFDVPCGALVPTLAAGVMHIKDCKKCIAAMAQQQQEWKEEDQ